LAPNLLEGVIINLQQEKERKKERKQNKTKQNKTKQNKTREKSPFWIHRI
jgi:hypothetical protein